MEWSLLTFEVLLQQDLPTLRHFQRPSRRAATNHKWTSLASMIAAITDEVGGVFHWFQAMKLYVVVIAVVVFNFTLSLAQQGFHTRTTIARFFLLPSSDFLLPSSFCFFCFGTSFNRISVDVSSVACHLSPVVCRRYL